MEGLSRSEYPGMLTSLQPAQAVSALTERVRRINKLNDDIADWLQERRKVEELYVAGLRKLLTPKVPGPPQSDLGVFQTPWDKILQSTDSIASSHHLYAQRIEKDVELPLRNFSHKKEMHNMQTISSNLMVMSKELDDAQDKSERLSKKGGKANAQKVDAASTRLEAATEKWESQSPFIFESLQDLDEMRVNHLRDVLTQLLTHEVDQASRTQAAAEEGLNTMLEIDTAQEIQNFAKRAVAGRPRLDRRMGTGVSSQPQTRQASVAGTSSLAPPSIPPTTREDSVSDQGSTKNEKSESKLRSRFGTMLGRRRQSIHGGLGGVSPQKSKMSFGRAHSSHGLSVSPRASSQNLPENSGRLSSLVEAESPTSERARDSHDARNKALHEGTNGIAPGDAAPDTPLQKTASNLLNGSPEDIFDAPPPSGPPPGALMNPQTPVTDADGFTIPAPKSDPISEAQKEAAEESDQLFNLKIANQPVAEEDADAKQAAMFSVANTLTQMGLPSRRGGTVRGRRDVRNSIYVPSSLPVPDSAVPSSPPMPSSGSKLSAVAALASEASLAGTADSLSVRSGTSLGSLAHLKHPEMTSPGLNSSVVETVSATFEDGTITSAKINGEIAFCYNQDDANQNAQEKIRINNFAALESIGPNRIFVSASPDASADKPDEFSLDTSHLAKTSPAFTYRIHADDSASSLAQHAPLVVQPAWKPAGDKLGLLLQYRLNPASALPRPVALANVILVATYESATPAAGAQTKPSGTHLKDRRLVYWRLGDVVLSDQWAKIVCRIVGAENAEPRPGHVEARWEYAVPGSSGPAGGGISVSRWVESKGKGREQEPEDDPFADDGGKPAVAAAAAASDTTGSWVDIPLVRRLVSGKYDAN